MPCLLLICRHVALPAGLPGEMREQAALESTATAGMGTPIHGREDRDESPPPARDAEAGQPAVLTPTATRSAGGAAWRVEDSQSSQKSRFEGAGRASAAHRAGAEDDDPSGLFAGLRTPPARKRLKVGEIM